MALKLYFHPLSSYCHKVLIAFYENDVPFEPVVVNFGDPDSVAAFKAVWPMAKMPALRDEARQNSVAESSVVIDYLDRYFPGAVRFVPDAPDAAWRTRLWDRFFDSYIHNPMQDIVADRLRPEDKRDAYGVEQAKAQLRKAYAVASDEIGSRQWINGDAFSLADCAAAPALFYANVVEPIGVEHAPLQAYLARLMQRPSYARVLQEARPYFRFYPYEADRQIRYPSL